MNGVGSERRQARAGLSSARIGARSDAAHDRDWAGSYGRTLLAVDFCAAFLGGVMGFLLRFPEMYQYTVPYMGLTAVLPVAWIMMLMLHRAYDPRLIGQGSEEFRRVFRSGFMLIAAIAILAYATKTDVARGYLMLALPLATALNVVSRYVLRKRLHALRAGGECMSRVLVVGHRAAAAELVRQLRRETYHGLQAVGVCLTEERPQLGNRERIEDVPVLGGFEDAAAVVGLVKADTVAVLAGQDIDGARVRRLAWQLEINDIDLCVAPVLMDVAGPRVSIRPAAGLPLLFVDHPELSGVSRLIKSLFDRGTALFLLLVLSPLLLTITLWIRLTSAGPAMFRQTRIGKEGEPFTVFKFRTMIEGAESMKDGLQSEADGLLFKIKRDPRITPVGRRLRKHSLDELPQLLNVLMGHMSLVGPRPPLPEEASAYQGDMGRRLAVKPGMTGLWQVSGRSDLPWEEAVRLDLRYVENWSIVLDLQILWKTWSVVWRGSGAY